MYIKDWGAGHMLQHKLKLESLMLSEKGQILYDFTFTKYPEIFSWRSRKGKSTETKSTLVVSRGQSIWKWLLMGTEFFWGDENAVQFKKIVMIVMKHCECAKCDGIVNFKMVKWILCYV